MKHQFNSVQCYDIERIPVNSNARKIMSRQPALDLLDPNAQDALSICENLRGSGCLNRGVSAMEAASLICSLLKKRESVQTTLAPELMELERQKLAQRKIQLELRAADINRQKEAAKERTKRHLADHQKNESFLQCFRDMAKAMLPHEEYSTLWDLANLESVKRQSESTTNEEPQP